MRHQNGLLIGAVVGGIVGSALALVLRSHFDAHEIGDNDEHHNLPHFHRWKHKKKVMHRV